MWFLRGIRGQSNSSCENPVRRSAKGLLRHPIWPVSALLQLRLAPPHSSLGDRRFWTNLDAQKSSGTLEAPKWRVSMSVLHGMTTIAYRRKKTTCCTLLSISHPPTRDRGPATALLDRGLLTQSGEEIGNRTSRSNSRVLKPEHRRVPTTPGNGHFVSTDDMKQINPSRRGLDEVQTERRIWAERRRRGR